MCSNNHHDDGHVAVWIPAAPGVQEKLIHDDPRKYYRPPYVGVRGWVGIELSAINRPTRVNERAQSGSDILFQSDFFRR